MPKMATKAADNVFYKARIAAASWNDRLGSREGASEVTGIDRTRLANIELGTINPHPEEVLMLSDTYNAPELQNHFCSHLCPLGIGTISPIELEELERVTLQLISAMKSLPVRRPSPLQRLPRRRPHVPCHCIRGRAGLHHKRPGKAGVRRDAGVLLLRRH